MKPRNVRSRRRKSHRVPIYSHIMIHADDVDVVSSRRLGAEELFPNFRQAHFIPVFLPSFRPSSLEISQVSHRGNCRAHCQH